MAVAPCRFGCRLDHAVVLVALSAGCRAFPDDREQSLCLHHAMRATPLGTIDVVAVAPETPDWERAILRRRFPEAA